jgi:catechol 2,3-dioxygenase-like lactoylglutathione lyase family enzyme
VAQGAVGTRLVSHMGMYVEDVEASLEFYEEVLGFRRLYHHDFGGHELGAVALGNSMIEFIQAGREDATAGGHPQGEVHRTHLSMTVESLDASLAEIERRGIPVFRGPIEAGPSRIAFVVGPDQRLVELVEFSGGEGTALELLAKRLGASGAAEAAHSRGDAHT